MSGNRVERIARVVREVASKVVLYELADPRIGFCTVTRVKVASDLKSAKVYVSILGDAPEQQETMKALERAAKVVQREVGPRLKTRSIPVITFEFDPSIEGSIRVSQLIREARATDADAVHGASSASDDAETGDDHAGDE